MVNLVVQRIASFVHLSKTEKAAWAFWACISALVKHASLIKTDCGNHAFQDTGLWPCSANSSSSSSSSSMMMMTMVMWMMMVMLMLMLMVRMV